MSPFKSEAQRKYMWARHPEIAKRWAHSEEVKGYRRKDGTYVRPHVRHG